MKKRSCSSHGNDKSQKAVALHRYKKNMAFDYNSNQNCFVISPHQQLDQNHYQTLQSPYLPIKAERTSVKQYHNTTLSQQRVPRKTINKRTSKIHQAFNKKLLLLENQGNKVTKPQKHKRESPKIQKDCVVSQIVNQCMWVITEDTHSSNQQSVGLTPQCGTPTAFSQLMAEIMMPKEYYCYLKKSPTSRNHRVISPQQSRPHMIDLNQIESDGRTTIMVRNIPNKYTQEMLFELFQKNHKKKFDFFYLPIDYNNNCNVGYAFLNFIHTKFVHDFYIQFHQRKWNNFNSVQVCQICYSRIQGTLQIEHHFEYSNVIQKKDKIFKPLIDIKSFTYNIMNLVQKQKKEHCDIDK